MKKLVLAASVAFAGMIGLNAQSMEALQIGARAGYNYSTLRGDAAKDMDTKGLSGFHVGLFTEIPLTEKFSVQPEVIYSTQGAKWTLGKESYNFKTQNINVPVLAKFYVAEGLNLQAGPQISFNTGSKFEYDGALGKTSKNLDKDAFSKVNFGAVVGAGYKLTEGLTIDARYNFGLTNVFDKNNKSLQTLNVSEKNDFKDGVFSVGLGYQF